MSELKERFIDDTYVEYYKTGKHELAQVYLKSEADKVIAELEDKLRHYPMMAALIESGNKEIAELKKACKDKDDWCLHTLKENRRHKYKRCLAMAEACMHKRWRPDEGFDYARSTRHMKKWIEIAEKFKEAK